MGSFKGLKLNLLCILLAAVAFSEKVEAFSPFAVVSETVTNSDVIKPIKMGFVHQSHYNSDFSQSFYSFDLNYAKKMGNGKFVADAFGLLKVEGDGGSTYSLRELYYSNKLSNSVSYSLGRKIVNWSDLENYLPAGFWNNAWDFNKSMPQKEGLVGAFLNYKLSPSVSMEFFASPLSVPKNTEHYKFSDDGNVEAQTLWFTPPPQTVKYDGGQYGARYFLDLDVADLLFNPQFATHLKWQTEKYFMKTTYFFGPSKDVDMGIDFALDVTSPETNVGVFVDPQRVNVHKGSLEFGRLWNRSSKTTVNLSYRSRQSGVETDPDGLISYIGTSSGAVYQLAHEEAFLKGRLQTRLHLIENTEIKNQASGELDDFLLQSLLVSFRYRRGAGLDLAYKLNRKMKLNAYTYYDSLLDGAMGSLRIDYKLNKALVSLGYNFVEALSASTTEFYKDFRANDSYHLGVSYVF